MFDNYKKSNVITRIQSVWNMIFGERIRRIVIHSVAAFCVGGCVTVCAVYAANHFRIQKGVGGLETSGIPNFTESEFDAAVVSSVPKGAAQSGAEPASARPADSEIEPPADGLLGAEDGQLAMGEDDSIDAATAVFDADAYSSDELELCYSTYRVKKGDMIGFIADSFDVTQDTIISVNNIHQSRLIQPGQYLKIPSMPGILYTVKTGGETVDSIAEKYEVSAEKCARVNSLQAAEPLAAGATLFVPDAQLDWVTRQEINGDLFHKPLHSRYWLSSYFGWRSSPFSGQRSYHTGVDMASPQGTAVYAALAGTVSSVGYNNVYGNYIIITHHSGYKTLYAHLSAVLVTQGRYVTTETRIGKVGSTGMSTGPHLHFTVYKNGKLVNPAALWK